MARMMPLSRSWQRVSLNMRWACRVLLLSLVMLQVRMPAEALGGVRRLGEQPCARALPVVRLRGGGGESPMELEDGEAPRGGLQRTIALMEQEMQLAAASMNFEDAARLRDAIGVLRRGVAEPGGYNRASEDAMSFDWERAQGHPPALQQPGPTARPGMPQAAPHTGAAPLDASRLWPESDAALREPAPGPDVDQADRAVAKMLSEARTAMLRADAGTEINICKVTKAFDAELERLVAAGVQAPSGQAVACLRLLIDTLAAASSSAANSRAVSLGAGPFAHLAPVLVEKVRLVLLTIGFSTAAGQVDTLELPEDYPRYILREAQGSVELKLEHLAPCAPPTPQQPTLTMHINEREVVVLLPSNAPLTLPQVPEDVYNFTARDLMDLLESNKKKYEEDSMLMTQEMRQRRCRGPAGVSHSMCRLRVRLSDGAMLEATFGAQEGVNAVLAVLEHVFLPSAPKPVLTTMPPVRVLHPPSGAAPAEAQGAQGVTETMHSLGLVPAGIINCRGQDGLRLDCSYLKPGSLSPHGPVHVAMCWSTTSPCIMRCAALLTPLLWSSLTNFPLVSWLPCALLTPLL